MSHHAAVSLSLFDATRPARILIVDDDDLLLAAMTRLLSSPGRVIAQAADADAALAAFRGGAFDVVISDIRMPGLSGIELLREVRAVDADVPVILMTGVPDVDSAVSAVELGALRYLQKPFDSQELIRCLDRAVSMRRLAAARHEALALAGHDSHLASSTVALEEHFGRAMSSMWMAFQPIVSLATGRPAAFEALLRTDEPSLKNPAAFLAAAERLGRVHELGRAVRAAVALAANDVDDDAVDLFVNLHPADLLDPELCDPTAPLSLIAPRVVLELTERASLDDIDDVAGRLARLRALGFRIALDDLGAGYAGLSCLAALEPDIVKLDMSLIHGIDLDVKRQRVVASMVELCRGLAMEVVIEGVETRGELEQVKRFGCDLVQGFYFARPARGFMPAPFPVAA
ncbi:MAG: EAL domain-containing response regulator [Deltaproteobacteria bacterium]|nr:EAL domain-containing response regulator [Deltaproteobacteria bacterium]